MELVADRFAEAVGRLRVRHHPGPGLRLVRIPLSCQFSTEYGAFAAEGIAARVRLRGRQAHDVLLFDPALAAVESEVETCPEEVLVERGTQAGCDFGGEVR